jgi:hypothetical protein
VGWRGDGTGRYPSTDPVTKWSQKEHVLWRTEVGAGQSSPILVGRRVLITSEPDVLVCLDIDTGRELWRKAHRLADVSAEAAEKGARYSSQYGDATPTPVSDGRSVWAFFGTGLVACHDLDGERRWMNWYDLRPTTTYGRTASPLLAADRLLVHFGPLACLDAPTGKLLWKSDGAKAAYGTPVLVRLGSIDAVVTAKGDVVRVADGRVLASGMGNCMYPSPVVQDRIVYFIDGSMSAVQLSARAADQIECKELWSGDLAGEFFASPVLHDGHLYAVDRAADYFVIDARTGKTVLKKTLALPPAGREASPNVYPSVCLAGKHLFVGNDAGESLIIEPGDKGAVVGTAALPGGSGGTPTFTGKRMFVRGGKILYCIGPE